MPTIIDYLDAPQISADAPLNYPISGTATGRGLLVVVPWEDDNVNAVPSCSYGGVAMSVDADMYMELDDIYLSGKN